MMSQLQTRLRNAPFVFAQNACAYAYSRNLTTHRPVTYLSSKRFFTNAFSAKHLSWRNNELKNASAGLRLVAAVRRHDFSVSAGGGGGGDGLPPNDGHGGGGGGGGDGLPPNDGNGGGGGDDGRSRFSFIQWYLALLQEYPVRTKAVTSALLNFLGDLLCQCFIEDSSKLDAKRMSIFTFLGFILVGPTLHFWYLSLSKLIIGSGAIKAGFRLLLDQFLFSPIFIGVFFFSLLNLEGRPKDIFPKLQQDWFPAVIANWKLWIPFQFLNFLLVPQQLQVFAANVIALAWNVYLSFTSHRKLQSSSG